MTKLKLAGATLLGVLMLGAISGCASMEGPSSPTPTVTSFGWSSMTPEEVSAEPGTVTILDQSTVVLTVGGSGSCAPSIDEVKSVGADVEITLADPTEEICTRDFVPYGFEISSESFEFKSSTGFELVDSSGQSLQPLEVLSP